MSPSTVLILTTAPPAVTCPAKRDVSACSCGQPTDECHGAQMKILFSHAQASAIDAPSWSTEQYRTALNDLAAYFDCTDLSGVEEMRFYVLGARVHAYERKHFPVSPPEPVDAILFRLEQQCLPVAELLPIFKTTDRMSEVLERHGTVTQAEAKLLEEKLGVHLSLDLSHCLDILPSN